MTREELLELVRRLTSGEYASEGEGDEILAAIKLSVRHPRVTNVLFYSRGKTVEQMVDELLTYQPLMMPPASNDPTTQ